MTNRAKGATFIIPPIVYRGTCVRGWGVDFEFVVVVVVVVVVVDDDVAVVLVVVVGFSSISFA